MPVWLKLMLFVLLILIFIVIPTILSQIGYGKYLDGLETNEELDFLGNEGGDEDVR